MKISDARTLFQNRIDYYRQQQDMIRKELNRCNEQEDSPDNNQAAVLELTLQKLADKQNEYQSALGAVSEQRAYICDLASSKKQGDSMREAADEMGKIMTIARRIMKGGKVPLSDEKKLMEFDKDLWALAKMAGELAKKHEDFDSLWKEKRKNEEETPEEQADNATASVESPAMVSTDELKAAAIEEIEGSN